jgi:prolyl oligopeptidase
MTTENEFQKVYYHKVGTPQSEDKLIYEDNDHPKRFVSIGVTEDQRYQILNLSESSSGKRGNALFFRLLAESDKPFTPIIPEIGDDSYNVIDDVNGKFLIDTNHGAPNGKVVLYDPQTKMWSDVLPERPEPLEITSTAGGKLFATYLKDVTTRAYVYSLDGKLENEIQLPGLGSAGGFGGRNDDPFIFYSFTSFNYPPTIFKYDIATKKSSTFRTVAIPGFKASDYEVKQVFYNSKDGTRVPMFITHRKGIALDGSNSVYLYGYGAEYLQTAELQRALFDQGVEKLKRLVTTQDKSQNPKTTHALNLVGAPTGQSF